MAQKPMTPRRKIAQPPPRRWPWFLLTLIIVALIGVFVLRLAGGQSQTTGGVATGTTVPSISLPSTTDHPIALTDYHGKKLVVYFYEGST